MRRSGGECIATFGGVICNLEMSRIELANDGRQVEGKVGVQHTGAERTCSESILAALNTRYGQVASANLVLEQRRYKFKQTSKARTLTAAPGRQSLP